MGYKAGFQLRSDNPELEQFIVRALARNKSVWLRCLVQESRAMHWRGVSTTDCIAHLSTPEPEDGVFG